MRRLTALDLNYLVNHPLIRPHMGFPGDDHISMDTVLCNPGNLGFWQDDIGGMLFCQEEAHMFEAHFLFIPGSGGLLIKNTARAMLDGMFTKHGARVIKGYTPRDNRAAHVIGIGLGFKKIPNTEFHDDFDRLCNVFELRIEDG